MATVGVAKSSIESSPKTIQENINGDSRLTTNANPDRQSANNFRQALVMVIWLTLQLVVSAVMTTLSAFHQFVPGSILPRTANVSDGNGAITSPMVLSAVSLLFTLLLLIVSIVDATFNMHHLVHQVLDKKTDEKSDCKKHEKGIIESCCSKLKKLSGFCSKFPMGIIRVVYCWIILNLIMFTVAANTYEWSWPTDHLKVLSNTALFLFVWITYILLLIVGILVWHCNFYMETNNCKTVLIPITVLIISNTIVIGVATVLATNSSDLEANFGRQICIRNVLAIVLIIYVLLSTSVWLVVYIWCICRKQSSDIPVTN